jgi:hypothetical protein
MNFTPASDYDNLLRQARALACIVNGRDQRAILDTETIKALKKQIALMNPAAVDAERETNRILTKRVEELESELAKEKDYSQHYERKFHEVAGECAELAERPVGTVGDLLAPPI